MITYIPSPIRRKLLSGFYYVSFYLSLVSTFLGLGYFLVFPLIDWLLKI